METADQSQVMVDRAEIATLGDDDSSGARSLSSSDYSQSDPSDGASTQLSVGGSNGEKTPLNRRVAVEDSIFARPRLSLPAAHQPASKNVAFKIRLSTNSHLPSTYPCTEKYKNRAAVDVINFSVAQKLS